MLSQLDNIIFPDRCEVFEMPSQRFVFPIFKNGYSTLEKTKVRTLNLEEIRHLSTVEIFVRDPIERFVSGLNSWILYNNKLDKNTLIEIACSHLFLNRHFIPQFHWIVNLRRFTTANIKINHISSLKELTELHVNNNKNKFNIDVDIYPKISFYFTLDKILTETFLGQTVTFDEIINQIKKQFPEVYDEVISRSIKICNVLD